MHFDVMTVRDFASTPGWATGTPARPGGTAGWGARGGTGKERGAAGTVTWPRDSASARLTVMCRRARERAAPDPAACRAGWPRHREDHGRERLLNACLTAVIMRVLIKRLTAGQG